MLYNLDRSLFLKSTFKEKIKSLYIDWTGIYTCKECQKTESRWNHTTTDHKEEVQLEDRRNVAQNICNSGDGTNQTGPILDVCDDDDDYDKLPSHPHL